MPAMGIQVQVRVFLVGCSRSGTTVVQRCLDAHPKAASFPETDFFGRLVGGWSGRLQARFGRVRSDRRRAAFTRLAEALRRPELTEAGNTRIGFAQAVDALVTALDASAVERGAIAWVEKTPKHFRYLRLIERTIPRVRFIHLVRDGRDVVASLVDRARHHPQFGKRLDPRAGARLWNEAIRASSRYRGHEGHLFLAYEDFIHDPERESRRMCDFLGLEFERSMLEAGDTAGIVTDGEAWKAGAHRPIEQQRSKFHDLLTEREQHSVMQALDWRRYRELFPHGVAGGRER